MILFPFLKLYSQLHLKRFSLILTTFSPITVKSNVINTFYITKKYSYPII